jgi:hypothetical protein
MKKVMYHPSFSQLIHFNIPHPSYLQSNCNVLSRARKNTWVGILYLLVIFLHFPPYNLVHHTEFDCHLCLVIIGFVIPKKMVMAAYNQPQPQPHNHHCDDHV